MGPTDVNKSLTRMVLQGHPGQRLIEITGLVPQTQGPRDFNKSLNRMLLGNHLGQRFLKKKHVGPF